MKQYTTQTPLSSSKLKFLAINYQNKLNLMKFYLPPPKKRHAYVTIEKDIKTFSYFISNENKIINKCRFYLTSLFIVLKIKS